MKGKTLIVLTAIAALAAATVLWLDDGSETSPSGSGERLFPELSRQLNETDSIRLTVGGSAGTINLDRHESGWRVAERNGYAADSGAIRALLLKLSQARILEPKTSNPALYARLGVEDLSADSGGVLLELGGISPPPRLIIGQVDTLAGRGTYVRRPDEAASFLVDEELRPARDPERWLDPELLDVPPDLLREVTIRHADGEELRLLGIDGHLALDRIPDGRALTSPSATSPIGRSLENLRLEDVQPESEFDGGQPAAVISYRLADGRLVELRAWQIEDARFIAVELGMAPDAAAGDPAQADGDHGSDADPETAPPEFPRADAEAVARRGEALAGWVFRIPVSRYDQMVRGADDLLLPAAGGD